LSPVSFEPPELPGIADAARPFGGIPEDPDATAVMALPPLAADASADVATRALRISEILGAPGAMASPPSPPAGASPSGADAAGETEPQGRTLADLYFAQGHYAEALRIYDELVSANPFDEELRRLRRDAEARLLPAGLASTATSADPAFERRLKRIRALRQWLSVLQAG
jgi:hypothetical protein